MEKKISLREIIVVASMFFGMLFGAGNLIFPASMGQKAGVDMVSAAWGFCITGVGLPLLSVV
ncbi:branched-chain amino acid transport system II carrier protein, partial [Oribacterium parvum]